MRRRANAISAVLAVGLLMGAVLMSGCGRSRDKTVPAELLGIWTTQDPRYEGRSLEFTKNGSMRIGTGDGGSEIYTIWDIESVPEDAFIRYKVTYLNSDTQEYVFNFYYDSFDGGILRFINQELNWKRALE